MPSAPWNFGPQKGVVQLLDKKRTEGIFLLWSQATQQEILKFFFTLKPQLDIKEQN